MLLFTAVDCPISDRYAPEVRRLAGRYGARGVRFWLVYANAGETPAAARDARRRVRLRPAGGPRSRRPLADRAAGDGDARGGGVRRRRAGCVYHGRIDDRYVDFGVDRPVPTTHDLADA